jgi:hypothetical protein
MTKQQAGYIFRSGGAWYGRWRRDELETTTDGSKVMVRRQHAEKLCDYGDRYRSKKDVQPLLATRLLLINEGREQPESTLSVAAYGQDYFLPYAEKELKPSTSYGTKVSGGCTFNRDSETSRFATSVASMRRTSSPPYIGNTG